MEEHRNLEKFVEKKLYVCKKKYIDIPKDEGQRYGKHFKALKSKIFGILRKESAQLDTLIAAYSLEGSVGDRLKVAKPNEFDLVFKLEFPYYKSIAVTRDPKIPGNVLLDMTRVLELLKDDPREDFQRIRELIQGRLVDAQNFLVVDRLRSWLQSLFSQALNRISDRVELVPGAVSHFKYRTCGPAHTIYVYGDYEYSVDFVPAIRLAAEQNVLPTKQLEYLNTSYWEAIPKPLKTLTETSTISFRSSFYAVEKLMLQGVHENCRNAIRFMKKFRDVKTNLGNCKSYYIKTLFLWKIIQEPNSYWQNPLSFILPDIGDSTDIIPATGKDSTANQLTQTSSAHGKRGAAHSKNVQDFLSASELFNLYNMLNSLKKDLLWTANQEDDEQQHSQQQLNASASSTSSCNPSESKTEFNSGSPSTTASGSVKGHVRRTSTASMMSTNSVSNMSDSDSDISQENDSGLESDGNKSDNAQSSDGSDIVDVAKSKQGSGDKATELAKRCRRHLNGLYQCLEQMTEAANYLTARYQSDIGPV
ncbi:GM11773 [Drosophila sechellia]|uniref:GM11773 n=1 Tax=Drosophila sechellia TaxID=7238 RepID=B4IHB6_DROSE|nr:GM11773 [Drosophila sechellia]